MSGKPVHDGKDKAQKLKTEASLPGLMERWKEGRREERKGERKKEENRASCLTRELCGNQQENSISGEY